VKKWKCGLNSLFAETFSGYSVMQNLILGDASG